MRNLFIIFILLFSTTAHAYHDWRYFIPTRQTIEDIGIFAGDAHGEFVNNPVVMLSDGSCWKIHPHDLHRFRQWHLHDIVHVTLRESHYWFKREHKFALYNHMRDEYVRAMMVNYACHPAYIIDAQTYVYAQDVVNHKKKHSDGSKSYYYEVINHYEKRIHLSDGSTWLLRREEKFDEFTIGRRVYVGVNASPDDFKFFLVTGLEREAVWTWAIRG